MTKSTFTRFSESLFRVPWPLDADALFGRSAPFVAEIGFGGGHFLVALAQQHPDWNILGVEHSNFCMDETERKVIRLHLPNVRLIHGDAMAALAYLFAPASLDRLHINFPDPFPKTKHTHRRLLAPFSLALITDRLRPGAQLHIATDVAQYAESIAADLATTPGLRNLHSTAWITSVPGRTVTRYERKAIEKGSICHYFEWVRDQSTTEPPMIPPQPPGEDMPNIVLTTPLTPAEIAAAFTPIEHTEGDFHIHLMSIYENKTEGGLLIDTFIDEPLIEQRPAISIGLSSKDRNRYVIRLAIIGYPRPTAGAHAAVRLIGEWLQGLHPDTRIVHHNAKG
jgi:tRNA (guanine-N7-)-methyltransferase